MAKTPRRKAEKLPAAQSRDEAIALLARYSALDAEITATTERVEAAIASLRAQADAINAPKVEQQKAIFLAIKPWWAVAGDDITEGKRKTWELGGCLIGHRTSNPALGYPRPEHYAVALLQGRGFQGLLRVKTELDKPAIVTALRMLMTSEVVDEGDTLDWLTVQGFSIVQKEEFFIDRLPPRAPATEIVADPAALQAQQVAA